MKPLDELRLSAGQAGTACDLLEQPALDAMDGCATALAAAVGRLETLQPSLSKLVGDPEALAEAWRLRRNVRRAAALLDQAATYHNHWQGIVGVMSAGYGPGGRPADTTRPSRVCLRG